MNETINPQELVKDTSGLVSLPEVYMHITEILRDPRCSAADISDVIAKDPALTVRLLRIVNSAYYGFMSRIDTLTRAIAIIGIDDLHHLVLATSVVDTFSKIPTTLVDMTDFWMRCVYCGVIARLLAKECSVLHQERLFIAGLLHDIGSLLMYAQIPDDCREVLLAANGDRRLVAGLETEMIGFTHADVGSELAKSWQLPDSLVEAIGCYLQPDTAVDHRMEAHLVYLGSRLCGVNLHGHSVQETLAEIPEESFAITQLDEQRILEVMTRVPDEFNQVFEFILPNASVQY